MTDEEAGLLATLATVILIREGGQLKVTADEWKQAVDHESSLWINRRRGSEDVEVVLMSKTVREV